MKTVFVSIVAIALGSSTVAFAAPAHIWKYDRDVVASSLKCELSEIAKLDAGKLPKKHVLKTRVVTSVTDKTNMDAGVEAKFPWLDFLMSTKRAKERQVNKAFSATFNYSAKNRINCKKINRFTTGLKECLREALDQLREQDGATTCSSEFSVTYTGSAEAKFPVWLISLGPSGSTSNTVTYKLEAVIPAPAG